MTIPEAKRITRMKEGNRLICVDFSMTRQEDLQMKQGSDDRLTGRKDRIDKAS